MLWRPSFLFKFTHITPACFHFLIFWLSLRNIDTVWRAGVKWEAGAQQLSRALGCHVPVVETQNPGARSSNPQAWRRIKLSPAPGPHLPTGSSIFWHVLKGDRLDQLSQKTQRLYRSPPTVLLVTILLAGCTFSFALEVPFLPWALLLRFFLFIP